MSTTEEYYPNIETWCRLCLEEPKDTYTIFDTDETQLSIPMRLMACLSLEAKPSDGLPKTICGDCRYQLEKSFLFRQRSHAADKKLRKHTRLVNMGKKSRVFAKRSDETDEDELEFEDSMTFIDQMENLYEKRSQKWREKFKEDIEKELEDRFESSREQMRSDLRQELVEEVRSDVRQQLRDEVQEECRKEQLAKLVGEMEVFLAEKKAGLWETLSELPLDPKIINESQPTSKPIVTTNITPQPQATSEPRTLRKRGRASSPRAPLKIRPKVTENQNANYVLDTSSKADMTNNSESYHDIKMVGAGDVVSSNNGDIYIISASSTATTSSSTSTSYQQDKNITSYNIKDNGDIQFTDEKSEEMADVVVFNLEAGVGGDQQIFKYNENVIIVSNENDNSETLTPRKRSKSDYVIKQAPQDAKPNIGRASDTLKTFQCQLCPIAFATQKLLSRHISTHIKTLKNGTGGALKCPVCQLQLSCASSLKRHMVIHTGVKPYKCEECELSFSQREVLKRHMDTHTGLKRHQCPHCEACFAQKTNLQQHINRMHSENGERQHKCHLCPKSFNHLSGLSRHLVNHAGVTFACKECGRHFNDRSAVQRHLQNVHKMKDTEMDGNDEDSE